MVRYEISYNNPLSSFIQVKTYISTTGSAPLLLQLPAWRPGRYELQNFAQKIQDFSVLDQANKPVPFKKITKDCWEVAAGETTEIIIFYNFYARQMDAGGSWVDETQLYVNPINCLLEVVGKGHQETELLLVIPENYQIASGLPAVAKNTLRAENYDQLVDSPFIASSDLEHKDYNVNNIIFHIWIQGDCKPNWEQITTDFKAFTQEQISLFGDFPVTEYHFLNQILPYSHYHGVEHSNSTVITLGPGEQLMNPAMYKELLGISSHELFHTWNIKKIRPKEMMPYDFTKENYFRTGYIAEGITTYYGDYILARARVISTEEYFDELNGVLSRHFNDYGHQHYSVAESSFDLWLDGYKPGIPDRKVSIYNKGALTALLLDLEIRRATHNKATLDTVMQRLWQNFGKTGIGYTEADYENLVNEVAQTSFKQYFTDFIQGTAPMQEPLNNALHYVGCYLATEKSAFSSEAVFGFKTFLKENVVQVTAIAPASPAAQALALDDELIAIHNRKVEGNLEDLLTNLEEVELTVFRNKILRKVKLQADSKTYYPKYKIQKMPLATSEQKENFKLWLKQDF